MSNLWPKNMTIVAVDARYDGDGDHATAMAAFVVFHHWNDAVPALQGTLVVPDLPAYEPGAFYKRELPVWLACLTHLKGQGIVPTHVVVDGYVDLCPPSFGYKPGLGRHLYDALPDGVKVLGVAKTAYKGSGAVNILRGESKKPLYVTHAGMDYVRAGAAVRHMHGEFRMPTLLKEVDLLTTCPIPKEQPDCESALRVPYMIP